MTVKSLRPLPDELAIGHLGRVRAWRRQPNLRAAAEQLCAESDLLNWSRTGLPALSALAPIAGMSVYDYVHKHTMLPFLHFASRNVEGVARATVIDRLVVRTRWATARKRAYFCPACVREDVADRGHSYWRRDNQLPARFYCSAHKDELLLAVTGIAAYSRTPCQWLTLAQRQTAGDTPPPRPDATTTRFHEITRAMLDTQIGNDVAIVGARLAEQAMVCNILVSRGRVPLTPSPRSKKVRLYDVAIERVQAAVLQDLFPKVGCGDSSRRPSSMSEVATSRKQGTPQSAPRALAMALLFSSAREAMAAVTTKPPPKNPHALRNRPVLDAIEQHKGNLSAAARALGVLHTELIDFLKVKRRRYELLADSKNAQAGLRLFRAGKSIDAASIEAHVDREELEGWIRLLMTTRSPVVMTLARSQAAS